MDDCTTTISCPAPAPFPLEGDLDDLIFRGEGWLASDR